MTAPTREQREEWRRDAASWTRGTFVGDTAAERILALLDALDAAEAEIAVLSDVAETNTAAYEHATERLAAVRALAEQWATQEPQSDGFSEGQISSGDQILQLLGGDS